MDTIGNAFKTIYQRFSSIREGTGLDQFGEDISNVEKDLNAQGIALRSDIGTFRNFDDVIQELSSHWSSYSDVVKSQLTQD